MPSLNKFIERLRYYCEEASVGYDWGRRWDLWDGGDTDCSALTIGCLKEAGFDTGSATYTGNLSDQLTQRGWVRLPCVISQARPGDILLNDVYHVATVVEGEGWNALIAQASIGETGGVYNNQPGDQTGWETNVSPIYDYPWNCILRYEGETDEEETEEQEFDMSMHCIFQPDDDGYMVYYDGVNLHPAQHPDEIEAAQKVHEECNDGKRMPVFQLGSKKAPWAQRFYDLVSRKID